MQARPTDRTVGQSAVLMLLAGIQQRLELVDITPEGGRVTLQAKMSAVTIEQIKGRQAVPQIGQRLAQIGLCRLVRIAGPQPFADGAT